MEMEKGDDVWYWHPVRGWIPTKVESVDRSIAPPSYGIKVDGNFRDTEGSRLARRIGGEGPPPPRGGSAAVATTVSTVAADADAQAAGESDSEFGDFEGTPEGAVGSEATERGTEAQDTDGRVGDASPPPEAPPAPSSAAAPAAALEQLPPPAVARVCPVVCEIVADHPATSGSPLVGMGGSWLPTHVHTGGHRPGAAARPASEFPAAAPVTPPTSPPTEGPGCVREPLPEDLFSSVSTTSTGEGAPAETVAARGGLAAAAAELKGDGRSGAAGDPEDAGRDDDDEWGGEWTDAEGERVPDIGTKSEEPAEETSSGTAAPLSASAGVSSLLELRPPEAAAPAAPASRSHARVAVPAPPSLPPFFSALLSEGGWEGGLTGSPEAGSAYASEATPKADSEAVPRAAPKVASAYASEAAPKATHEATHEARNEAENEAAGGPAPQLAAPTPPPARALDVAGPWEVLPRGTVSAMAFPRPTGVVRVAALSAPVSATATATEEASEAYAEAWIRLLAAAEELMVAGRRWARAARARGVRLDDLLGSEQAERYLAALAHVNLSARLVEVAASELGYTRLVDELVRRIQACREAWEEGPSSSDDDCEWEGEGWDGDVRRPQRSASSLRDLYAALWSRRQLEEAQRLQEAQRVEEARRLEAAAAKAEVAWRLGAAAQIDEAIRRRAASGAAVAASPSGRASPAGGGRAPPAGPPEGRPRLPVRLLAPTLADDIESSVRAAPRTVFPRERAWSRGLEGVTLIPLELLQGRVPTTEWDDGRVAVAPLARLWAHHVSEDPPKFL